jgi:hypothetical protein
MKPLNEKEYIDNPKDYKANDPKVLNKLNDPETGLKAQQTAQNDAIATRMAKDVASSFGKSPSPPKPIPYMPPYKRINQQSISGPVTKANEENTMSLIHDKKTLSVADAVSKIMEAEKMAKKDHDQDGKIESGKDEYLGSRIRAAKMSGKLKEEEQIDEAFPTVADGEKSLRAKEGKTSMGTVSKTKTGLVHTRDYEDDTDEAPAKKGRPTGGGAGKSTKKKKLTEMIAAYKERGIDSLYEEPDNATFTKELEDQKAKFDGKKKGGDVAKPSVQAVKVEQYEEDDGPLSEEQLDELSKSTLSQYVKKAHRAGGMADFKQGMQLGMGRKKDKEGFAKTSHKREKGINKAVDRLAKEEVEQIDEISKETAGKYLTAPQGKGANKYKTGEGTSKYPDVETMGKHANNVHRALSRAQSSSLYKKPSYYKEEVEQMDERTLTSDETQKKEDYVKGMKKSVSGFKARYGDKAKSVMYATATKMAKKD